MSTAQYVDEVAEREEFRKKHLNEGLFFKNLKTFPVIQRKLRGTAGAHFSLADYKTIDAHISEIPPGGHNNRQQRIDWGEGDLFSPPLNWWHQHFNDDPEKPARYLAITNVALMTRLGLFTKEQWRPTTDE
jgi:hypothetical protein